MNNTSVSELIGILIVSILLALIYAAIGWWLWGVIMVSIFGLPQLTFAQFCGLYALCNILFKSTFTRTIKEEKNK